MCVAASVREPTLPFSQFGPTVIVARPSSSVTTVTAASLRTHRAGASGQPAHVTYGHTVSIVDMVTMRIHAPSTTVEDMHATKGVF